MTKRLRYLTLPTLFSLITSFSFSQATIDPTNCRDGENVEYCRTHHRMNELKQNPAFLKMFQAEQASLKQRQEQLKKSSHKGTVYTIPVVFHILHNGGVENISQAQVLDAVDILNEDFRLLNSDANNVQPTFQGMPSDIEIEFALATKAPNGQCFGGITRTQNALSNDGSDGYDQVVAIVNGNDIYNNAWPGDEYMNVFIVNDAGGAAGYTTNPSGWSATSMTNGIWILHDYVGSIGTGTTGKSRALTHEVGHWLNLSHLWGPNNNPGNSSSCSDDDGVDDTPRCIGVTSCNLTANTCSNDAVDGYWNTDVVDNVENFMEYSYCSKMFTNDQRSRMRAAITSNIRNNLWQPSNLNATGANTTPTACVAQFIVDRQVVCAGDDLVFTDDSYSNISSWNWSFQGGSPSSTTFQNPQVNYANPGQYDVTLTVTDVFGNSVSQTFPDYITVLGSPGNALPISEGFENTILPNSDWFIENSGGPGFAISSQAAFSGSKSLKLNNSAGSNLDKDAFVSSTIDLENITAASLTFKYAFAKISPSNSDFLQIFASSNCGESWAVRKSISSSQLATVNNTASNYTPGPGDWETVTISNFSSAYQVNNLRIKFLFTSGGGNDLYIDDINLTGPVGLQDNETIYDFFVFPNPANSIANVQFLLPKSQQQMNIQLHNIIGEQVKNIFSGNLSSGQHNLSIDVSDLAPGVYFVTISNPTRKVVQRFIVE
ncbi:MAG: M43 family zinc metalloprotease [Bacteroidota bacterium]|nr:M43 family zinc metalloprotease [Bacteroidota bacterium]